VGKEYLPLKLKMKLVGVFGYFTEQLFRERLGAELAYQAFIVNFAPYFPGRDNHFVFSSVG
jgi:hypothetical protein